MFKNVGKRVPKYDNIGAVTGAIVYPSDVKVPGMLTVKVLRCPYHRAKINSVDYTEAEAMDGVYGVVSLKDAPFNEFGMVPDNHVFADDITHYYGQTIAAVAAIDQETAMQALTKIKVDMEELPYVIDPREAMKEDAPVVFGNAPKDYMQGNNYFFDGETQVRKIRKGDVEKGFAEADVIVEGTYQTPSQEHAFIEPCATVAYIDEAGRLVIHSKAQGMYFIENDLCNVFGLPLSKMKFEGGTIGGGFGGMNSTHTDHIAGLLALKTKQPVKYMLTREEETMFSTVRSPWIFKFKDGVKNDGTITAREIEVIHDCGAFTELGLYAVEKNANFIAGALKVENVKVDSRLVYTNKAPSGSMRGFGVNVGQYADQVQVSRCAAAIGMDPIELRLRNSFKEGDISHTGNQLLAVSSIETLQGVAEMAGQELSDELKAMKSK